MLTNVHNRPTTFVCKGGSCVQSPGMGVSSCEGTQSVSIQTTECRVRLVPCPILIVAVKKTVGTR